ncbi:MAG: carbon-nitrogen hydrolase family protein [Pseudomonadota bacterium]
MKLALAQLASAPLDIAGNLASHLYAVERAAAAGAELVAFPELSLTGYWLDRLGDRAFAADDTAFDPLQDAAERFHCAILAGLPTRSSAGRHISQAVFRPDSARQVYAKQLLHNDEQPYFIGGDTPLAPKVGETQIGPAICYESLHPTHAEAAREAGAEVYLACVAKTDADVANALDYMASLAQRLTMAVALVNGIGESEGFESAGGSAAWSEKGRLVAQLPYREQGLLIWDPESTEAEVIMLDTTLC